MIYGDKPEEGFFYKNTFIHKKLDFSFGFDNHYYFLNNPNYLLGITDKETKIIFDIDKTTAENNLKYLSKWMKTPERKIINFNSFLANNFRVTTGLIERKKIILKVGAISDENFIYRFILITNKNEFDTFSESFKRILNSFKKVSTNKQLSDLSPPKIRILRNSQNNNFLPSIREKISLQTKYSIEIFKIINDYENKPEEKRKIKSIY